MTEIFPPEIIENTVEYYHTKISSKSKIIYLLFLLMLAIVFISLPFVHVDITSQSRGVIRTPNENTTIQSAVYGQIINFDMYENKSVSVGDTLVSLNAQKLIEQIDLNRIKITKNAEFIFDLEKLLSGNPINFTTAQYHGEYNRYKSKLDELNTIFIYLKNEYTTDSVLYEKAVLSKFDYLKSKNNYENTKEQLNTLKKEYLARWELERTNLELQNDELESQIKQLNDEKKQYTILASCNGKLIQVAGFQVGNFIAPGQTLAYVSAGDSLIAECYISPAEIGYIREKQKVTFRFDAFNYREWGMLEGEVIEILHDVIQVDNQTVFRVRCLLNNDTLYLKNGYKGSVQKGLTFSAHFFINRRSLWNLLFDKVDNWLNPKQIATDF